MASTSATPAAGPSTSPTPSSMNGQNQHPLLENNEEKNRSGFSSPITRIRFDISEILISCSVVIKVGMVGDSQIGKTSLMVKYVEGSFDEDYIQTLGTYDALLFKSAGRPDREQLTQIRCRRQLYGKDDLSKANNDYLFYMGFRRYVH